MIDKQLDLELPGPGASELTAGPLDAEHQEWCERVAVSAGF